LYRLSRAASIRLIESADIDDIRALHPCGTVGDLYTDPTAAAASTPAAQTRHLCLSARVAAGSLARRKQWMNVMTAVRRGLWGISIRIPRPRRGLYRSMYYLQPRMFRTWWRLADARPAGIAGLNQPVANRAAATS